MILIFCDSSFEIWRVGISQKSPANIPLRTTSCNIINWYADVIAVEVIKWAFDYVTQTRICFQMNF